MVGIHMFDRAFLDLDDFSSVCKIGDDIAGLEVGCAGEPAVEMRRHDMQSPEREVAEAGIEPGFRMAGEKPPLYPRRVRRISPDVGESTKDSEPRMGEGIAFSGGCQQYGSTRINLDIGRMGGQSRYQDQRRAVRIGRHIDEGGKGMTGVAVDRGKGASPGDAQQLLCDSYRVKIL